MVLLFIAILFAFNSLGSCVMWKMIDENRESHQKSMGSDDDYVSDLELCIRFQIIRLDLKKKKKQ